MFLGIDFGTTYLKISTFYQGKHFLLLNPGEYGLFSSFFYDNNIGVLVGNDTVYTGQRFNSANCVSNIKNIIASGSDVCLDERLFTPHEILKELFKALFLKAIQVAKKQCLNDNIEGVVISVPSYFGAKEQNIIIDAIKDCLPSTVIPIKAIIKDPVSVAIAYHGAALDNDKNILVYDLGGCTCDVALVSRDSSVPEHFKVIDYDTIEIGGNLWDEEIVKYAIEVLERDSGVKISGNAEYEENIRKQVIKVKHDLSDKNKSVAIICIVINGINYNVQISIAIFDEITSRLLNKTLEFLQNIYDKNSLLHIDEIICSGGSCNMLQVEKGLKKRFPDLTIKIDNPEYAIVTGATFYANMTSTQNLKDLSSAQNTNEKKDEFDIIWETKKKYLIGLWILNLLFLFYWFFDELKDIYQIESIGFWFYSIFILGLISLDFIIVFLVCVIMSLFVSEDN